MNTFFKKLPLVLALAAILGVASIAFASLNFTGTMISGDSNVVIDTSSTISIGTSSASSIMIGRGGDHHFFPRHTSIQQSR